MDGAKKCGIWIRKLFEGENVTFSLQSVNKDYKHFGLARSFIKNLEFFVLPVTVAKQNIKAVDISPFQGAASKDFALLILFWFA